MSVLFCDLVGFTAASEPPIRRTSARAPPVPRAAAREIERYGGTVEKFIGDAVMAVFGAPVAHEDDPERAVRAGLRILEAIEELNEADPELVAAGAGRDQHGRGGGRARRPARSRARGSSPATSSTRPRGCRAAAPVNGVAVSEQTYRQTERVFDYEQLEPVDGEGEGGAARDLAAAAAAGPVRLGRDPTHRRRSSAASWRSRC